jgi:hypothetical protein
VRASRALAGLLVAAAATPGLVAATSAAAATPAPTLLVAPASVAVGAPVSVLGTNWPSNSSVRLAVCGNEARRGGADCDTGSARTATVGADGVLRATLDVAAPPSPCPCVVLATSLSTTLTHTMSLVIAGVPVLDPAARARQYPDPTRSLAITSVALARSGTVLAWFGARPGRRVVVSLRNDGNATVTGAVMTITMTRGSGAPREVARLALASVAPADTVTVSASFHLDRLAIGTYRVTGDVPGLAGPVTFSVETGSFPWGLAIVTVMVAVALLVVLIRGRRRRRRRRRSPTSAAPIGGEPTIDQSVESALRAALSRLGPVLVTTADDDHRAAIVRWCASDVAASVAARHHLDDGARVRLELYISEQLRDALR